MYLPPPTNIKSPTIPIITSKYGLSNSSFISTPILELVLSSAIIFAGSESLEPVGLQSIYIYRLL